MAAEYECIPVLYGRVARANFYEYYFEWSSVIEINIYSCNCEDITYASTAGITSELEI